MSLERTYRLVCDTCATVHGNRDEPGYSTPRRARAAAKGDGWSRRTVVVGQRYYWYDGVQEFYDDKRGQDFCEACTEQHLAGEEQP